MRQAMALPIRYQPGTYFQYGQRTPDLLNAVIEAAVGQDLQAYAQKYLFGPVGIGAHEWFWMRDRTGNTYGCALLFIAPRDFARLGTLMLNSGKWRGRQVIPAAYVARASSPSPHNPCYGYLFWLNGHPCIGPSVPARRAFAQSPLDGLPADAFAMMGALHQTNFMVPSLHLLVSWTGAGGDVSPDPTTVLSASPNSELFREFFRILGKAFEPHLPDPGPYEANTENDYEIDQFADPMITLGAVGLGPYAPPDCTILICAGTIPSTGVVKNAGDIVATTNRHLTGKPSGSG